MSKPIHPSNESMSRYFRSAPEGYEFSFETKTYEYTNNQGEKVFNVMRGDSTAIAVDWIHPNQKTRHFVGLICKRESEEAFYVVKLNHSCRYGFANLEYACDFLAVEAGEMQAIPDVEFDLGI